MKENTNIFNIISFWIIVAIVFLVPLFFLPLSVVSLYQAKISLFMILTMTALSLFVIERIRDGKISIPSRLGYTLLALIPLCYFVSGLFGMESYKSIIGALHDQDTFGVWTLLLIFAFLVSTYVRTPKRITYVLTALFSSTLILMIFQVARIIVGDALSLGVSMIPASTLAGSWNELAVLAVILLGMTLVLLETVRLRRWGRVLLMVTLVLPFLFITLSSLTLDLYIISLPLSVIVGIVALVVFAYIFSLRKSLKSKNADELLSGSLISPASLVVLIVSLVLIVFGASIGRFAVDTTGVVYTEVRPTWQSTAVVAKRVLVEDPLLGTGANTFTYAWDKYRPADVNNYQFWNNNFNYGIGTIPSSIVTMGTIGFLLWLLFYAFVISLVWRVLFNSKKIEGGFPVKIIVAFGALFTTATLFFYTPGIVVVVIHFLFLGILFGLDMAAGDEKVLAFHDRQWQNFIGTILLVLSVVGLVYGGYRVVQKNMATYYANLAIRDSAKLSVAIAHINRSLALDSSQAVYSQIAAQLYAAKVAELAALPRSESEARAEEIKASIVSSVNYANNAERLSPNDYSTKIASGRIYQFFASLGIEGANEEATVKFAAAASSSPTNPMPYILASYTELSSNNYEASKNYIINALQLKSDYSDVPDLGQGVRMIIEQLNKFNNKSTAVETVSTSTEDSDDSDTPTKPKTK